MEVYNKLSGNISKKTTQAYSTSFSWAIKMLDKEIHQPIYNIYGFVRLADEIVDSFHGYDKEKLLNDFEAAAWLSLQEGISVNPILQSFQKTVNQFNIDKALIESFFYSMRMD
ncbi:MAG: phytoene/squalene synthase family protein, partial [Tannerellaceae bacterium]